MKLNLPVAGIEKVSLINYPGKIACTVFTSGCNLRCRYCHNRHLVLNTGLLLNFERVLSNIFELKNKNIVVTGGEPLINSELKDFLKILKENGFSIKLDTNGTVKSNLTKIIDSNLVDYIAIDLKGFDDEQLKFITRRDILIKNIIEIIRLVSDSGIEFELRYTIWNNDVKKMKNFFSKLSLSKKPKMFLQKFRHSKNNLQKNFDVSITEDEINGIKTELADYVITYLRNS